VFFCKEILLFLLLWPRDIRSATISLGFLSKGDTAMPVPGYEKRPPRERKAATALKKALVAARRNGLTKSDVMRVYDHVDAEHTAQMRRDLVIYALTGKDRKETLFTRLWHSICLAFGK
jgi:hypothetical protein